jgi:hypothetical protein
LACFLCLSIATAARASDDELTRRAVKNWRLGEPPPTGYHVGRKHTWGIVGVSIFGAGYVLSATLAAVLYTACYIPAGEGSGSGCSQTAPTGTPWLFVPLAGPFIALSTGELRHETGASFWLPTFGVLQVAGASLLAYDLLVPHYGLKRGERLSLRIAPLLAYDARGLGIAGTF